MKMPLKGRTGQAGGIAAFGVALAALGQKAEGAIQVYTPSGGNLTDGPSDWAAVSFNPVTGNSGLGSAEDVRISNDCSGYLEGFACSGNFSDFQFVSDGDDAIAFLSPMDMVDGSIMDWASPFGTPFSGFIEFEPGFFPMDDTPFYFGFRFKTSEMDVGEYQYGYAEYSTLYDGIDASVTLYSFAVESTINQGISVSAIPEPGFYGAVFGLVIFALVGWKRFRKKALPGQADSVEP